MKPEPHGRDLIVNPSLDGAMPQIAKGGKFVFGWSLIRADFTVKLPDMAVDEYKIASEGKVILIAGNKTTEGFVVSRKELIGNSQIKCILKKKPQLNNYELPEGQFVKFKGQIYCWLKITEDGCLKLNDEILRTLSLKIGDRLLSIRGSNIAFVMGVKGPLIEAANNFQGKIETY
jgi:hypothetical protein